jgi:hypothetical protein
VSAKQNSDIFEQKRRIQNMDEGQELRVGQNEIVWFPRKALVDT